jgi:hypothetical protein
MIMMVSNTINVRNCVLISGSEFGVRMYLPHFIAVKLRKTAPTIDAKKPLPRYSKLPSLVMRRGHVVKGREKMEEALVSCQYRRISAVWLIIEAAVEVDIAHLNAQSTDSEDSYRLP